VTKYDRVRKDKENNKSSGNFTKHTRKRKDCDGMEM
jgi:hypothetical protein